MIRTFSILGFCCSIAACAQQPVILLDPARGGAESGARVADRLPEKQVTLDLAGRLASLLRARGFTVALTRETDIDVTNDARAAIANNLHPIACILLHATPAGSGVHLYTTALHQRVNPAGSPVRWDDAQAPYTDRSRALADDVRAAFKRAKITASNGQTWMRPLDNMQCPAMAIEVAPEADGTGAEDSTYQAQISNALANTLLQWRGRVGGMTPPEPLPQAVAPPAPAPASGAVKPVQSVARPTTEVPPGTKPTQPPIVPPAVKRQVPVVRTAPPADAAKPNRTEP